MKTEFNLIIKKVTTDVEADLMCWPRPDEPYEITKLSMPTDDFISLFETLQNGQLVTVISTLSDPIAVKSLRALAPKEAQPVFDGWINAHC